MTPVSFLIVPFTPESEHSQQCLFSSLPSHKANEQLDTFYRGKNLCNKSNILYIGKGVIFAPVIIAHRATLLLQYTGNTHTHTQALEDSQGHWCNTTKGRRQHT